MKHLRLYFLAISTHRNQLYKNGLNNFNYFKTKKKQMLTIKSDHNNIGRDHIKRRLPLSFVFSQFVHCNYALLIARSVSFCLNESHSPSLIGELGRTQFVSVKVCTIRTQTSECFWDIAFFKVGS